MEQKNTKSIKKIWFNFYQDIKLPKKELQFRYNIVYVLVITL